MEPPKHDDFEPDRLASRDEQHRGRRALKEMATWIRETLKDHAKDPVSEITTLDELKDFFGEEGPDGKGGVTDEVNPYGTVLIRAKRLPRKTERRDETEGENGKNGDQSGGGTGLPNGGENGGKNRGDGGEQTSNKGGSSKNGDAVDLLNPRAIVLSDRRRQIAFTPSVGGRVSLSLYESGADSDYAIAVKQADKGVVANGAVQLQVKANARQNIIVHLSEPFVGALKVVAHEL